MKAFIIYPRERGFAIQLENGTIIKRFPFGTTYSVAKDFLDHLFNKPIQLSLNF